MVKPSQQNMPMAWTRIKLVAVGVILITFISISIFQVIPTVSNLWVVQNVVSLPASYEVYKGANYMVQYVPAFKLHNETHLVVKVRINNTPVDFGVYAFGPGLDGFVEVGKARGRGEARMPVGRYISEAVRLVKDLGYTPRQAGPGLLLFVVTSWKEGNETYVGTQIVPVPIIPGEATGRGIVVEINFKPHIKHRMNSSGNAAEIRTSPLPPNVDGYPTLQSMPSTVTDYCVWIDPFLPSWKIACYIWFYKYTEYDGWSPIIFATTHLDLVDGGLISEIHHYVDVAIIANKRIYFELGAEIDTGYLTIPGPGFTVQADRSDWTIFKYSCRYINANFTTTPGECSQYVPKDGSTRRWEVPSFDKDVILATGTYGRYKVGVYEYKYCECPTSDGYTCTYGVWRCITKSTHRIHWIAPELNPDTQAWYPYSIIDDSRSRYWDAWVRILQQKYDVIFDSKLSKDQYYTNSLAALSYTAGNVLYFAFGLPLRVFGLGVSAGTSYDRTAYVSVDHVARAGKCAYVKLRRYYTPQLYLEPGVTHTWQKSELVQPIAPAYWPYSLPCG
ncbi:hypothetical protein Pogu_1189 [Pyrobaculum oguniense TE7]|uniref:Uncharacterized protein n=1 Tax=Pyrobaculum oguniense (strain DSM 13380 / JCM 10595 / TE7) TaxID=698757 RepID=H6Q8R1_PYROT|nr:hypothetical protein Pogu_1189 [Pyrobaculum oguniense TE7]